MAHVTAIVSVAQVEYRVAEGHGCAPAQHELELPAEQQAEYRVQGMGGLQVWVGAGLAEVGLTEGRAWMVGAGSADAAAARTLMGGAHPMTGEQLVGPVLRLPVEAKLPGVALVDAVVGLGLEAATTTTARGAKDWARLVEGARRLGDGHTADVRLLSRVAARAGVDLAGVYGADRVQAALGVAARERVDVRTKGYDLTLTLPKSFSVAWALAPAEQRQQIADAYTQAALDVVATAQEWHAKATRGGHGDGRRAQIVDTSGLLGWLSVDPVNRNGDAHWHAHVTLAAMGRAADGGWSALASAGTESLFTSVGALGGLMEARARALCAERFGWQFRESAVTGRLEVAHVPDAAVRATSTRRADVVQAMLDAGLDPATVTPEQDDAAGRVARKVKIPGLEQAGSVVQRTREQVAAEGVDPVLVDPRVGDPARGVPRPPQGLGTEPGWVRTAAGGHQLYGPQAMADLQVLRPGEAFRRRADGLVPGSWRAARHDARALLLDEADGPTAHASSFTWRQALGIVAAGVEGFADRPACELLLEAALEDPRVVRLPDRAGHTPRYTLQTVLDAESTVLSAAEQAWFGGAPTVTADQLAGAVAGFTARTGYPPTAEQHAAVQRICRGGLGFDVLTGLPGTGKTTVMRIVADAYAAAGIPVTGVSTAAIAADNLAAEAVIPATTVARHLLATRAPDTTTHGRPAGDRAGSGHGGGGGVLIVDEAAMVDTRAMAALLERAAAAGTKVVAVGDDRQLPAVGIGGWFAPARAATGGLTLVDARRQTAEHEQAALRAFRAGAELDALTGYAAAGQIVVTDTRDQALAAAAALWHTHTTASDSDTGSRPPTPPDGGPGPDPLELVRRVALLAGRREDAQVLNTLARSHARAAGQLSGPDATYRLMGGGVLRLAAGDPVLLRRNEGTGPAAKRNGRHALVEAVDADRVLTVAWTDRDGHPQRVQLTPGDVVAGQVATGYLEADHVQGGAAGTVHLAQGRTVDHTVAVVDPDAHAATYVAMSRDRQTTTLVLSAEAVAATPEDLARLRALPAAERTAAVVTAYAIRLHTAGGVEAEQARLLVERWPELLSTRDTLPVDPRYTAPDRHGRARPGDPSGRVPTPDLDRLPEAYRARRLRQLGPLPPTHAVARIPAPRVLGRPPTGPTPTPADGHQPTSWHYTTGVFTRPSPHQETRTSPADLQASTTGAAAAATEAAAAPVVGQPATDGVAGVVVQGDRWIRTLAAVDPRLATDHHYGSLCGVLDRMQADGIDVTATLAWVTHDRPLPDHPGRSLETRLITAGAQSPRWLGDARPSPARPATPEPGYRPAVTYDPPAPQRGISR